MHLTLDENQRYACFKRTENSIFIQLPKTCKFIILLSHVSVLSHPGSACVYTMISFYSETIYHQSIEQHALQGINNCWNTNISFYLETSGGQNSNLHLNIVPFFNNSVY